MTTSTALCLHADVDGDESRCPCAVPAGMSAEDWELAKGHRCRILTTQDDTAWLFAVQMANGSIDDGTVERPTVQTYLSDDGLTAAEARRFGHALIQAADRLDALIAWRP
jgi:hypothetical protein